MRHAYFWGLHEFREFITNGIVSHDMFPALTPEAVELAFIKLSNVVVLSRIHVNHVRNALDRVLTGEHLLAFYRKMYGLNTLSCAYKEFQRVRKLAMSGAELYARLELLSLFQPYPDQSPRDQMHLLNRSL